VPRASSKESADLARRGLVSRSEASRLLGLSRSAVRAMDGVQLAPITVGSTVYYHRTEIDMLLSARSGVSAQRAFSVFQQGGGPDDAVVQHALPPELAERLWQLYLRLQGQRARTVIVELPAPLTAEAWRKAHGYERITPDIVRRALEMCARDPELKRRLLAHHDPHAS
jgi:hypothetical protein